VSINIKVQNILINLKPSVTITGPSAAKPFSATVTVTGTASDPEGGLSRVEMSLNGGGWSPVTGASTWSYPLDTTALRNGKHTIQVRAFDGANFSDIAELNFTVSNVKAASGSGPNNMLLLAGIVVVIAVVAAAALLMRRRKPGAAVAQSPATPAEAQPPAAQPNQPQAAAVQPPAAGYYPPQSAAYPMEYRQSDGGQEYAPQQGFQQTPDGQAYPPQQYQQPPEAQAYQPQGPQPPRTENQ
jgi:hypothetical protein